MIQVFSVSVLDNGFFDFEKNEPTGELEKFCFNSWKSLVKACPKYFNQEIKVFGSCDKEYEYMKKFKSIFSTTRTEVLADIYRFYILSLYDDMLYLDFDILVTNPEKALQSILKNNILFYKKGEISVLQRKAGTDNAFFSEVLKHYEDSLVNNRGIEADCETLSEVHGSYIDDCNFEAKTNLGFFHLSLFQSKKEKFIKCVNKKKIFLSISRSRVKQSTLSLDFLSLVNATYGSLENFLKQTNIQNIKIIES